MENITNINEQKHEEALKQKEVDASQLLEYIKYNGFTKNVKIENELRNILENNTFELNEEVKKELTRVLQISRGYTEYKVIDIAENSGFNRTRTKTLIQYLIQTNQIETVSVNNTTFIRCI